MKDEQNEEGEKGEWEEEMEMMLTRSMMEKQRRRRRNHLKRENGLRYDEYGMDGKEDWRSGNYQRIVMPFKEKRERESDANVEIGRNEGNKSHFLCHVFSSKTPEMDCEIVSISLV